MAIKKLKPNQHFTKEFGHIYSERPILFQTDMVRAILDGRKTQTRRKMNPQPEKKNNLWILNGAGWSDGVISIKPVPGHSLYERAKYGKPGDLLWVRETWGQPYLDEDLANCKYLYRADWAIINQVKQALVGERWKPSIHMPKEASRIWLMIEDIRVERVQEISEADAIAEGIEKIGNNGLCSYRSYAVKYDAVVFPYVSFQTLWQSINGHESWESNPWVWLIQFRVLSKTGRPSEEVIDQAYSEIVNPKSEIRKEVSHV